VGIIEDLVEGRGEEPAGSHGGAQDGTAEVEQMQRLVVVGDVECRRVIAQAAQRAIATAVGRPQPLVNRRAHVYLPL